MRFDRRIVWVTLAAGGLILFWLVGMAGLIWSTLGPAEQQTLADLLTPRLPLLALGWVLALMLAGLGIKALFDRYVLAPARLAEQIRVLLGEGGPALAAPGGSVEVRLLAQVVNDLAAERDRLRADMRDQVETASRAMQEERNRLAALMAELSQSVVVCNLDGRILLYNHRARLQFRTLSAQPHLADGSELIGIGRSIYGAFDRRLVDHAFDNLQRRLARGVASPTAQFVTTTRSAQILRVQMAAVRAGETASQVSGFLLMLDNVTRDFEQDSFHDRLIHGLTTTGRHFIDSIRAAHAILLDADDDHATRNDALATIAHETAVLAQQIDGFDAQRAVAIKTRWPLEDMLADDLLAATETQIERHAGCAVTTVVNATALWLRIDSFALLQAITSLATRLVEATATQRLTLVLSVDDGHARLDMAWPATHAPAGPLASWLSEWETTPMRVGDEHSPLTVRDVVDRHQARLQLDHIDGQDSIALLLPLAEPTPENESGLGVNDARPEYYDFDLFGRRDSDHALHDRRLADLTLTVFDTETTGLQPSGGDQIIQIGAVRIVNGKLLRQESFDRLVDPGRRIPAASIPIHGITDDMVAGKPGIDEVLPVFHAFADDTILVAHNAAFDMKFLQLRESTSGVAFRQPVLDTLLLSALVHPNQASHRLEAIAQRFDILVQGRHTALGDALVTAEVMLRLLPLLEAMGIHTLGNALKASQGTLFARVSY